MWQAKQFSSYKVSLSALEPIFLASCAYNFNIVLRLHINEKINIEIKRDIWESQLTEQQLQQYINHDWLHVG